MSLVTLNVNPGVHLDVLNRQDNEDIETLAIINLGCTRNDVGIELSVPFTVIHGTQLPLYNLRWAKLKPDPNWVNTAETKLVWSGLPSPVPPALPIWVYKLDGLNVPSVGDFLNSLPKIGGLELPDLSKLFSNPFQDISFAFPSINIQLPDFTGVYNFFKDIQLSLGDFFSKWPTIDTSKITELLSFINLNGLENLLTSNPLYSTFSWILEKIKAASETIQDIWTKAEEAINKIYNWTVEQIKAAESAITNFFTDQIKNLSQIKFDNLLSIPSLNIDINLKNWLQGFSNFGDPVWILQKLSEFTETLVNITVSNLQSIFNWALEKATEFWNYLQTIPTPNLDFLKNIWPQINLSFPTFNLQIYPPAGNLIQFPVAGIPLPTPIPFTLGCVYPQVSWPDWMTTPDIGVATIPTQIPPGVPSAMPPIATPSTTGVIAFQSLPGFVYNGELKLKTLVDPDSSNRLNGIQSFDLYLLANSDPSALLPAGGNLTGAVARIRFVVDLQDPKVAISVNPKRENPTIVKNSKVVSFVYDPDVSQTYTFDVPVSKILYAQGVTTQDIQMDVVKIDYPDLPTTSPYYELNSQIPKDNRTTFIRNLDGSITLENLVSALAVNKIYYFTENNTKEYISTWSATEQTPILINNKIIRHWKINVDTDFIPETVSYLYITVDVIKTLNNLSVTNNILNLSNSEFISSVIVTAIEYTNNSPVKLFDNTNLPWAIFGTLFDADINAGPSNEQAILEANKITQDLLYGYSDYYLNLVGKITTNQAKSIFKEIYLYQSYLYNSQLFQDGPTISLGKYNYRIKPIVTDYYSFSTKPAYQNSRLTDYIRNLSYTVNNILASKNISFRLNKSIYAWLGSIDDVDLLLQKSYALAEPDLHNIIISPNIVLVKPTPFSTNEQIVENIDLFIQHIIIHELIHTSMSSYITSYFDMKINGQRALEIFTDYLAILIMGFLYPEKIVSDPLYFTKGRSGYYRFPDEYITNTNFINAAFAVVSTNSNNFIQTKEIIKANTPITEETLTDDRRLPTYTSDTFNSPSDILDWYKSFSSYDPLRPRTSKVVEYLKNKITQYPVSISSVYHPEFKRVSGGLIYTLFGTWIINSDGIVTKIAENGELL